MDMEKKPIESIPVPEYDTSVRKRKDGWLPNHLVKIKQPEVALRHARKLEKDLKRQLKKWERKDTMRWTKRHGTLQRIGAANRKIKSFLLHAATLINREIVALIEAEMKQESIENPLAPSENPSTTDNGALSPETPNESK
jgi:hypothetical protein